MDDSYKRVEFIWTLAFTDSPLRKGVRQVDWAGVRTTGETIPEGKVISKISGGKEALSLSLSKLKKFEFSGYLRTVLLKDDYISEGYFLVKDGTLVAALYGHRKGGEYRTTKQGEEAQKLTWADSYDTDCDIEVHGRLEVDGIIARYPEAKVKAIPKPAPQQKRRTKFSLAWGTEEDVEQPKKELPPDLRNRVEEWRNAGYVVKSLEELVGADDDRLRGRFSEFEESVKRVEFLRRELEEYDLTGHDMEVERVMALFKNPTKLTAIEAAVQDLKDRAGPRVTEEAELTAPMASKGSILPSEVEGEDLCNVCGSEMRGRMECPTCGAKRVDAVLKKPREEAVAKPSKDGNLIAKFTFDEFVVGECNRLSQAAATAVANNQSSAYNPLLICSGAGLGKTHLLNAIGHEVLADSKDKKVLYITTETFINEFIEATKANRMGDFRKKYRDLDFLLLDDVHFIAGQEAVQDELFHTFNTLYKKGKQIVMTCDRQIKDVPGIKDRLVSRFEAGLITDMQSPDYETRLAILKKKAEMLGAEVGDDVLALIARTYKKNIRKLEGALNKILAHSELLGAPISLENAKEALKEELPQAPEEPELVPAIPSLEPTFEKLKTGHSYLIEEEKPVKCFELFVENLNMGLKGLGLIRMNPKRVREEYDMGDALLLWLTDKEGDSETKTSPVLERIIYKIEDFLNSPGKSVLLIDGLDFLISNNTFDAVIKFLRRLIDEVSESQTVFIMSLTPETIDEQGLKTLEREMEIISYM